jgi:hypothetical protein
MVEHSDDLSSFDGFGDELSAMDAAAYIQQLAHELAGLARSTRLADVAVALDRVTALAAAAQSRENDASDNAA